MKENLIFFQFVKFLSRRNTKQYRRKAETNLRITEIYNSALYGQLKLMLISEHRATIRPLISKVRLTNRANE